MRRKFLLRMMILSLLFAMGGGNLFAQTTVNNETSLKTALAIDGEVILGADIALVEAVEIPENVNVTLDLNGNTIKNGSGNSEYVIYNQEGGTLTIKDSGTNGEISGVVYTGKESTTFIDGGTFNAITNYALLNSNGTLTINGGTINGNASYPVYSYNEGHKLVINYGVVVNGKAGCVNAYGNNGTVEINGGEFNFEGVEGKTYHIVYVSTNTSMTINGGTFLKIGDVDLNGEGGGGVCVNGGAALTVTGGTFDGAIKDIDNYATTTTIEVSGGTFSDMSAKDYITEGSTVTMAGKTYTKTEDGLLEINEIKTKEDLIAFAVAVNGGNDYQGKLVALMTDITLTDEWTPIGNGSRSSNSYTGNAFKGVFDGGGKIISGLSIASGSDNDTKGLFGVVDGGTVKNLKLTDVNINTSSKNAGAAVGLMVNNSTVDSVEVYGTLTAPDGVGGVVGRMIISGTISNCTNNAVVSATTAAGGIVGKAYYSALNKTMNITDCVNEGAITGDYAAGGIAGLSAANISNCSNTAVIASNEAGGIVGEQIMYGTINNNENSGLIKNINNGGFAHGGIIGWLRYHESTTNYPLNGIINVTNNTNTANIEAAGAAGGSGGIVGHVYNQANITGNMNSAEHIYGGAFAAGIAGGLQQEENNVDIENTTITVSGNVSLTSLENISGLNTGLFAYNNALGTFVVKDNLSNSPVASVDGVYYLTLEEAFTAATDGQTIILLADATPVLTSQRAITKASVIDLGGKTLTLTEDDLYFGTTTFQNGNIVVDPSVKASTAVFWMFANQTLTLDNVKLTATGVTGTYLIGINGGTGSNVNLLNNTEIIIENEEQAGLTAVICDNGTGNNVTIENSVININKVEGRFYLGGTNGTITVNNTNIDLNGVKEGFYLRAGQTLAIEGTSNVEINLNDTNDRYGINVTDLTATYTIAETATVEATVYEPAAAAKIGTTKYATFQAAVNAAANDDVITLLAEINENVTVTQKADVKFTIDGAQNTMKGAITVDGKSATIMTAGVTIKNINFDASNITTEASINLGVKGNTNTRYICNLTVENCKFSDTDYSAVAIKSYTGGDKNLVVKGCEATGMHSLAQLANVDGLTVSECTVDCARGIALGSSNNVIIDNCDIKAFSDKYGVRADANVTINITIKDSKINAFIPVVVREVNAASNIAFQGTNTMTATNTDGLWCAIGTSEYETNGVMPTAPTGQVTVTLNDTGLNPSGIYGNYAPIKLQDVNNNVIAFHTNFEDALAAAIADENVARIEVSENVTQTTVKSDEYYDVVRPLSIGTAGTEVSVLFSGCSIDVRVMGEGAKLIIEQDLTIEGLGVVANGFATSDESMVINGTLKALSLKQWTSNETITVSETGSVWLGYGDGQFDMAYGNGTVTINGNGNKTEPQFKAGYSGTRGNGNTLNLNNTYFEGGAWFNVNGSNGIFNIDNSVLKVSGGDNAGSLTVTSSGNTFNLTDGAKLDVATLELGAGNNITIDGTSQLYVTSLSGEGTINIDATNLTETSMPIVGNASDFAGEIKVINNDDLKVIIDENGNVHIVEKVYVAQIGETKYESLQDALNAGGEITVLRNVNLTEGLTVADDKTVTLDLNGKTITGTPTEQAEYVLIANLGELTITDNTETKEGKILCNHTIGGSGNYAVNTISNRNGGVLTIVAGIIENTSISGNPIGYAIDNYPGSAVIIKGGKITASGSNYYDGIRQFCNSETLENSVTIEGGEVSSLWLQNPSDGTVDKNTKDVKGSFAISGGTLNNLYLEPSTAFSGSITGGYVGSVSAFETAEGRDLTGFISGGTFSSEVPAEFLAEGFELVQNEDGTYGVVESLLKGKGTEDNPYLIENLEDLIAFRNSVNAGETKFNATGVWVALADDIDMAGTNWTDGIGDGINATFDGCFDGKNYTIKNFTMEAYADSEGYVCGGLFGYIYGKNGAVVIRNLVMENVTVTCDAERTGDVNNEPHNIGALVGFAMRCENSIIDNIIVKGDIKIDAQYVDGVGAIVGYSHTAAPKITNCKVVANDGSYIKGHSFVGGITGYSYSNATITDCTVENIDIIGTSYSVGGIAGIVLANNVIKNCTVSENVDVNGQANVGYLVGAISSNGIVVNIENCSTKDPMIGGNYGDNQAVIARIENKYYSTLEAALTAANNETVTLIADTELAEMITITNGKTVTLDLNGKTITGTDTTSKNFSLIDNRGNLTITDSSEPSTGKMTLTATVNSGWSRYSAVIANNPGGMLTIVNGTLEHFGGTDMAYGIDNLTNGKGTYAETVIKGGYIKSTYRGVRQFLNGEEAENILTVNGGTIEGANKSIWMQDPSKNANTGTLTVGADAKLIGDVYLFVTAGSTEWPVTVSIVDSALQGESTVMTANVPAGYEVQSENGVYGVKRGVAKIDNVLYPTLAAAATAAQNGETIQLLWQEGQAPIAMNASLYGKDVTITGTATVDWNKGNLFIGRGGAGNATLTFDDANLTSASNSSSYGIHVSGREKDTDNKYDGTLVIKNSTIELDYLIDRGTITLDEDAKLTVKNGFGIAGRPASETESCENAIATISLVNGAELIVYNHNGMGVGQAATELEGYGVMNIDATSTFETTQNFNISANGTMNNNGGNITINGTLTVNGNLNSSGNITGNITKADAATIILTGGTYTQDVDDWCHEDYDAEYNGNNTWTVIQTSGTQTREFAYPGWYWFSTYIQFENGEEGLDELQEQLGSNAATIKGQTAFTNYQTYNGNNFWTSGNNSLTSISASDMYMIKTTNEVIDEENDVYEVVTVSLDGGFVDYENYEITLKKGWNWIGYPLNTEVNVKDALAGFTPENGDQIKGKAQGSTSTYMSVLGGWFPDFEMIPGEGYMYLSNALDNKSLIYKGENRNGQNVKTSIENNHWIVDEYKYPNNMTVTAMLSIDGEIVKDNYEVAAFANGECRGSARPIYIEALDAYMLFMTIQGEDVENLTFKYYDVNYGTEYELNNTMVYSNDAIVGTIEEPYMFNLGILNIEESSVEDINIYPNPTTTGNEINLQAMCDKVEVFNALGVKVAEYTNVDSIDAIETAGIYVIRVTIDGNARNCRLIVK